MIFGKRDEPAAKSGVDALSELVATYLPEADAETRELVVAIAGLLAGVVYADRKYHEAERAHVRKTLGNIHALPASGADAICALLDQRLVEIALRSPQAHTRVLREYAELDLRREVLDALVDLAAADHDLSMAESDLLRRTVTAMGLTQDDYVASQARHRQHLSVLKK